MTEIDKITPRLNLLIERNLNIIEGQPLSLEEKDELRELQKRAHEIGVEKVKQEAIEKEEKSREMRNRRRRGKYTERKLAKDIGGRRKGGVGQEDIAVGIFSIEAKHVTGFLRRMEKGLDEATRHRGTKQIAIYVEKCGHGARVYLDWCDWVDLHGKDRS